jgi:hypothetical protein
MLIWLLLDVDVDKVCVGQFPVGANLGLITMMGWSLEVPFTPFAKQSMK